MSQPLVLPELLTSMLESFAPPFTKPSFATFRHYVAALILGEGRRTGAAIARTTANAKSPGVYARVCSRARWSADALLDRLGGYMSWWRCCANRYTVGWPDMRIPTMQSGWRRTQRCE